MGWGDRWLGKRLIHTQSSEAFCMGLLAKEVTFGIGNLDSVSLNPQHSTNDQKVTVSLIKVFQVSEFPAFWIQDQIEVACPGAYGLLVSIGTGPGGEAFSQVLLQFFYRFNNKKNGLEQCHMTCFKVGLDQCSYFKYSLEERVDSFHLLLFAQW